MRIKSSTTVRKLAVCVVSAAAVTFGVATGASADATQALPFEGHMRAQAAFFDHVDHESFRICDLYRDGMPVGVQFSYIRKNGTRQTGALWHTAGVEGLGNRGVRGCSAESHNFAEGRRVWYR